MSTERNILDLLAKKYTAPAWAFLPQVANGTGANMGRISDALAMSLWPSRGIELIGFEIKTSRSDWLRELKSPEKADVIVKRCHRWYVVAADKTVVDKAELPSKWGLMIVGNKRLRTVVQAPDHEPEPPTWAFIAAIMRRVAEIHTPEAKLAQAFQNGRREAATLEAEAGLRARKDLETDLQDLRISIQEFENASGIRLNTFRYGLDSYKKIGEAVKMVLEGSHLRERERLLNFRGDITGILKAVDEALSLPEGPLVAETEDPKEARMGADAAPVV